MTRCADVRCSLDFVSDAFTDGCRPRLHARMPGSRRRQFAVWRPRHHDHRETRQAGHDRSDNGTELASMAILKWCQAQLRRIALHRPARQPMQNGLGPAGASGFEIDDDVGWVRSCIRPLRATPRSLALMRSPIKASSTGRADRA